MTDWKSLRTLWSEFCSMLCTSSANIVINSLAVRYFNADLTSPVIKSCLSFRLLSIEWWFPLPGTSAWTVVASPAVIGACSSLNAASQAHIGTLKSVSSLTISNDRSWKVHSAAWDLTPVKQRQGINRWRGICCKSSGVIKRLMVIQIKLYREHF